MNLWPFKRSPSQAARDLALEGIKQRHDRIIARAQQMRRELNLPDDPRLAA